MWAPFMATPKSALRRALRAAKLEQGETLYDLGSGTARALIIGEKEFGAKGIGFEIGLPIFISSRINLFLRRAKSVRVFRKSFFDADLSKADVIFMFLTPRAFVGLEDKFVSEIRPGCRVVTFSSPLKFWQPQETISLPDRQEKLYLYKA